jgi:hypothetical protein
VFFRDGGGRPPDFPVLQSSVKEPAHEGLHHDGDKEGQEQISRDRKAEAQSSMRNYGRVLINVEISRNWGIACRPTWLWQSH